MQCSFVEYRGYKVIYRRYASLFFIVGVKDDDSEVRDCICLERVPASDGNSILRVLIPLVCVCVRMC